MTSVQFLAQKQQSWPRASVVQATLWIVCQFERCLAVRPEPEWIVPSTMPDLNFMSTIDYARLDVHTRAHGQAQGRS